MYKLTCLTILLLSVLCQVQGTNLPQQCRRKGDPGRCLAYIPRWEYNPTSGTCEKFIYGGCGGHVPFMTLEECQKKCQVKPINPKPEVCKRKGEVGPCRAAIQAWEYNSKSKRCESFIYGGCKGFVPFKTKEACLNTCHAKPSNPKPEVCKRQGEVGPCRAAIPSWQYNSNSGRCETFIYGGCKGFVPFKTEEACINTCDAKPSNPKPKACMRKGETGPCRGAIKAWQYDPSIGECETFTYGGCKGYVPFKTKKDCQTSCQAY